MFRCQPHDLLGDRNAALDQRSMARYRRRMEFTSSTVNLVAIATGQKNWRLRYVAPMSVPSTDGPRIDLAGECIWRELVLGEESAHASTDLVTDAPEDSQALALGPGGRRRILERPMKSRHHARENRQRSLALSQTVITYGKCWPRRLAAVFE